MAALHAASGGIAGLKGSREYQRLPLLVPSSKAAAAFRGTGFAGYPSGIIRQPPDWRIPPS
jgi:hypothetical protein